MSSSDLNTVGSAVTGETTEHGRLTILDYVFPGAPSRLDLKRIGEMGNCDVFSIRTLDEKKLALRTAGFMQTGGRASGQLEDVREVRRRMFELKATIRIIVMVRDPIAAMISVAAQRKIGGRQENGDGDMEPETLLQKAVEKGTREKVLKWFAREFTPATGIDVLATPFPVREGFVVIEQANIAVLLLRYEASRKAKNGILSSFLGLSGETNFVQDKRPPYEYSRAYSAALKRIVVPEELVKEVSTSTLAGHFFSPEEMNRLTAAWGARPRRTVRELVRGDNDDWRPEAVVVHQMGKVGSSSIFQSLVEHSPWPVYHTHVLNTKRHYFYEENPKPPKGRTENPAHIQMAVEVFHDYLIPRRPLAVISLVREPIARNVSAFFQNLQRFPGLEIAGNDQHSLPELPVYVRRFKEEFTHDAPLEWFDKQMKEPFGVDVYAFPFDPKRGYVLLECYPHRFLIMRAELDDDEKERVIRRLLKLDAFVLERANVSEVKPYGRVYASFKNSIDLSPHYVDKFMNSVYARHFYTEQERESFRRYWLGGARGGTKRPERGEATANAKPDA
jgi:hypothetical protein